MFEQQNIRSLLVPSEKHPMFFQKKSLNILFSLSCNARAYIFQNSPRAKKYVTSKFCLFESFYKAIENISLQSFD